MHSPRKRFGQHFLSDPDIVLRIISAIDPQPQDIIVEIGPGKGVLTYPLLERVSLLHAVEIDRDLASSLERRNLLSDKLYVHCADALKVDFAKLLGSQRTRFIGNLPYNISTPLIFHLASFLDNIVDMYFMLQREIVERLVAPVGSKQYGRLSVIARCCFEINALFEVAPQAFRPQPKVMSAFAYFKPQSRLAYEELKKLDKIVRLAFSNKRKTSANALSKLFDKETLEHIDIDPCQRPETLTLKQFIDMLKYSQK